MCAVGLDAPHAERLADACLGLAGGESVAGLVALLP
jgi:hypothetical protein